MIRPQAKVEAAGWSGAWCLGWPAEPATIRSVEFSEVVIMTPVLTTEAFAALGAPQLVYVRPVKAAEILASVPSAQIEGIELDPDQTLYAVHRADGERLAVLTDRDSAMAAALAH
jgi:hypothetical protein